MTAGDEPLLSSEVLESFREANKQIRDRKSNDENSENLKISETKDSDMFKENGEFIDEELEEDYKKYVKRKNREGKTPRDRKDWKETRDYWLNDSPMARGNKFNKKSRQKGKEWYPYNEVNLEDGTRLDSYDVENGEIISRKATDLDKISIKTYEAYLKELRDKYPPGKRIRSNAYPELNGEVLAGRQILEIPDSNKQLGDIEKYKEIARKYGIELRFRPE